MKILLHLSLLLLLMLPLQSQTIGVPPNATNIVGGWQIDIDEVPWQVSLERAGSHFCGGVIISNTMVLTAAHCINGVKEPETLTVHAGSTD